MLRKIRNILLYAGVDSASYNRVKRKIEDMNLTMTTVLSTFATILITGVFLSSFSSEGVRQNRTVYMLGIIMSITILLLSVTIAKRHSRIITLLIYLSYFVYYMYGILIGAITDPTGKTVTFMVMLVFMPILFIAIPLHLIIITTLYVSIFVILCLFNKEGAVLSVDIMDAIVFGILGTGSGSVINHMKVKGFTFEQKLQEISRIDQLTQLKNRNAFEVEHDSVFDFCKHSLACVYIDVNGLHEINNDSGHEYGDIMLKFVAYQIRNHFSNELSYRIGGDEYIIFVPDKTAEELEKSIEEMNENIKKKGYHIALGYEITKNRHTPIDTIIKSAEIKMFHDKNQYYKDIANRQARNHN